MLSCIELTDPFDVPVVDGRPEPGRGRAEADFLAFHVAAGLRGGDRLVGAGSVRRGLPLPSSAMATTDMPTQTTNMMANTAEPWRLSLTMRPNVNANANGMTPIAHDLDEVVERRGVLERVRRVRR